MSLKYEMSKTYQYRKVVKPLLERKRRARINKCLDDLKDLIAEFIQQENDATHCQDMHVKLEKADILEVTVNHLRKLKAQRQYQQQQNQQQTPSQQHHNNFRSGYIQAANEVSKCLASLPKINVAFGTKLMTHLGLRLNQLEAKQLQHQQEQQQRLQRPITMGLRKPIPVNTRPMPTPMSTPMPIQIPLKVNCLLQGQQVKTTTVATTNSCHLSQLHSPVSSGYGSDSDSSRSSPSLHYQNIDELNQSNVNIWRPW